MNLGFLVFPDVEELDFAGPWELAGLWGKFFGGPAERWIVAETAAPVVCAKGLSVLPHLTCDACPRLDALVVPGGQGTRREVDNPRLIRFIAEQGAGGAQVLSICTGAFLLQRAGLLAGKTATAHWNSLDRLRALPDVAVAEERWVRADRVWSAAGVSAGLDLMLAFIAETAGSDVAGRVQLAAEYYPAGVRYGTWPPGVALPAYLRNAAR